MQEFEPAQRTAPFPLRAKTSHNFEEALDRAVRTSVNSMLELRGCVEKCVCDLRGGGMGPAEVLITLKAYVRHTARTHPPLGQAGSSWAADALMDEITKWAIVEFYKNES